MPASEAAKLLRPGLLEGVWVLLAGAEERQAASPRAAVQAASPRAAVHAASPRAAVHAALVELGARVGQCEAVVGGEVAAEADIERAVAAAPATGAGRGMLIVDGAGMFAAAGAARAGLGVCTEAAWCVTRALAGAAFIPGGRGGRIVYLAPAPGAGSHAPGARAALENLARTLSIEWARHGITAVTIGAGDASSPSELATLAAYLGSEAGAYFSGCMLDLAGSRGAA